MSDTFVTVTLTVARKIFLAKAIEQSDPQIASKSALLSKAVSHRLGERTNDAVYLEQRADSVLNAVGADTMQAFKTHDALPFVFLGGFFFLLAFFLGFLSEKLTENDSFINLLSFPFWGFIAWNLLIYVLLFLRTFGIFDKRFFPIRNALSSLRAGKVTAYLRQNSPKNTYRADCMRISLPLFQKETTALLHLSAIAFALGLISAIALRGVSTAFTVGWESTWFSDNVDAVKLFIDSTYGLIPSFGPFSALPDTTALADIRSDRLPYLTQPVSAAPWLLRMMALLTIFVIIPRLFLFLVSWTSLHFLRRHLRLGINDPYFKKVLEEGKESVHLGSLVFIANKDKKGSGRETLEKMSLFWGNPSPIIHEISYDAAPFTLPTLPKDTERTVVLIYLDSISTPEEETIGELFRNAVQAQISRPDLVYAALLETRRFATQFSGYSGRIQERTDVWMRFAKEHEIELFLSSDGEEQLVKNVRQWASLKNPVDVLNTSGTC